MKKERTTCCLREACPDPRATKRADRSGRTRTPRRRPGQARLRSTTRRRALRASSLNNRPKPLGRQRERRGDRPASSSRPPSGKPAASAVATSVVARRPPAREPATNVEAGRPTGRPPTAPCMYNRRPARAKSQRCTAESLAPRAPCPPCERAPSRSRRHRPSSPRFALPGLVEPAPQRTARQSPPKPGTKPWRPCGWRGRRRPARAARPREQ